MYIDFHSKTITVNRETSAMQIHNSASHASIAAADEAAQECIPPLLREDSPDDRGSDSRPSSA
jgi:hypothetical protein